MAKHVIVLIEDSREDASLVKEALDGAGLDCEITAIEDGAAALSFLSEAHCQSAAPDLFLVDLNLPQVDGLEVVRQIQTNYRGHSVGIIVMSSSNSSQNREGAAAAGAHEYFCKPLDLDEFMKLGHLVRSLLERRPRVI